jgi:4-amino-4-deoxy-L-arabinose transferase-like glycosyltransferase
MLHTVMAVLVVAYLPGALIYRLPFAHRPLRAALAAEERAFWAVVLSVSWSLAVVIALAALDRYNLDRLLATNGVLCGLTLAAFRTRLGYMGGATPVSRTALIPVGLIAIGAILYFPSSEYIIGGKDPGTYINEGVQIAQTGSLLPNDSLVSSVPAASRDLFFPWHKSRYYYGLRFMGFFVRDPSTGAVVGQFPHLFPASIAIAYDVDGLSGARAVVGLWGILGLLAVYFVGARLFGPAAAASAAVLLAINVVQVWFSRYPNSESVMQGLVFAALLAFARATEGSRLFFGIVSGALLGLMLFLRYDVVLAMAALAAAAAVMPVARRVGAAFGVALITTGLAGLWYLANPMIAYSAYPLTFTRDQGGWLLIGGALAAVILWRWLMRRERFSAGLERILPVALAAVVVVLAIYAYFLRAEGGRTALHDAMAFRTFAWYVTPWALGIAVAGLAVLLPRWFWRDPAFFIALTTFSLFFFYKTRIVPDHFWASRRFLAVILPGTVIVLAGIAKFAADRLASRRQVAAALLVPALLAPLGVAFWRASSPVRSHIEYEGLIPPLETLANSIGPRDLLLVESRDAGSDLHVLGLPLAYIYSKQVLVLDSAAPAKRSLENFVSWAEATYERVLFLGGGGTDLLSRHLAARFISGNRFQVKEYDSRINEYPRGVLRKDLEFGLYQLTRQNPEPRGPLNIPVGKDDDLNVVRFHARERMDDTPYRWSGPQSFILLLGIPADARRISLWMSNGGRPATAGPAAVEVALDDNILGTVTVGRTVSEYTVELPPTLAARAAESDDPARLRLRVPPWVPAEVLGGSDTRQLGVMVTRVEVR